MGEESVEALLEELQAGIKTALGPRLTELYLYGSAATGGFEPGISDVDLLAATAGDISDDDVDGLRAMHGALIQRRPVWNDRIEAVFLRWMRSAVSRRAAVGSRSSAPESRSILERKARDRTG